MASILFVVTSTEKVDYLKDSTGYDVREVAIIWNELKGHHGDIKFASPKGGICCGKIKPGWEDRCEAFLQQNPDAAVKTKPISDYISRRFDLIYFVGGIGAMWDFPYNKHVQQLLNCAMKNNTIIASICHGAAAYVGVRDGDRPFVQKRVLTAFSDEEERNRKMLDKLPFSLEQQLTKEGAIFKKRKDGESNVVVDKRMVTAQNPASMLEFNKALIKRI